MSIDPQVQNQQAEQEKRSRDENMEKLRQALESERARRKELEEKQAAWESQAQSKPKKGYSEDEDDDEPYVDSRKLNRKFAKFEEEFDKKIDERAEQRARMLLEQEKQQSYIKANPDFQEVLSQENIQKFAEKHPAIAERMLRMPDNFDRQALLYEQIKTLKPQEKPQPSVQERIDQNRKSPYYQPSGIASGPYAMQGDFSQAGQKNAYEKMKDLISKRKGL